LLAALAWFDERIAEQASEGRAVLVSEQGGEMTVRGVKVHGRADRIDRLPDGKLAIVDYKTGQPPSGLMVEKGFSLQLGLIGLIAREGGFPGVEGEPECFEYWSLARAQGTDHFGLVREPVLDPGSRRKHGIAR